MDYDVIVIGSGLGGLTAATRLSVLGYKVGVFEQHFITGGYATNFKRKGYTFDVSLHGIGGLNRGGSLHNILSGCKVIENINVLRNEDAYRINYKNEIITISNDINKYKNMLLSRFKGEEKNINKLFNDLYRFKNGFNKFILNEDKNLLSKLHIDVLLFIKWSSMSTYEVLRTYTSNEDFIRIFTALWTYYGLPPKKLSALYFFIPWVSYHIYGKYYIEGGAQKLSDSFTSSIKKHGGQVYLKSKVKSIRYSEGRVKGIKLENGERFNCKYLISNISPIETYKILPENSLRKKEILKIKSDKIGCTLSQLYIGLDINPSEIGIPDDEIFFFEGDSHENDYEMSINNKYEESGFLLTNYTSMDKFLNKENHGVITMTYIDNYDYWSNNKTKYKIQKDEVIKKMINRLEKYYKGISNHIIVSELGTPKTMERYTLNPKGAVYGYEQSISQSGRYRLKKDTSIDNLSFVGAWVNPGGGYEGSISGGMVEASRIDEILKNMA